MEIILFVLVFSLVTIGLMHYMKLSDTNHGIYETIYCRGDVRAVTDKIKSQSDIEVTRNKLNSRKSKF